jgi:hypothetical protein
MRSRSNLDPLDFVEGDCVACAIVELRRSRALVRGHGLRVFKRAAGLEIRGNAGSAENMAAELVLETGLGRAPADHAKSVDPVHRRHGQDTGSTDCRAEEGAFGLVADSGRGDVRVEIGFEVMVRRHLVALTAFFVKPHPPALANRHGPCAQRGADLGGASGGRIGHVNVATDVPHSRPTHSSTPRCPPGS